jgi:hypothetical protein
VNVDFEPAKSWAYLLLKISTMPIGRGPTFVCINTQVHRAAWTSNMTSFQNTHVQRLFSKNRSWVWAVHEMLKNSPLTLYSLSLHPRSRSLSAMAEITCCTSQVLITAEALKSPMSTAQASALLSQKNHLVQTLLMLKPGDQRKFLERVYEVRRGISSS